MERNKIILIAGVVLALITGAGIYSVLAGAKPKTEKVIIASTTIPARTQITESELEAVPLPPSAIPAGTINHARRLIGSWTTHTILPGQTIQAGAVQSTDSLTYGLAPGDRAMAVPVTAKTGVGGQFQPGDQIDIIVVSGTSNSGVSSISSISSSNAAQPTAATVLQHVTILNVEQSNGTPVGKSTAPAASGVLGSAPAASNATTNSNGSLVLTVAVTPPQAQTLALAMGMGDQIYVDIDPPAPSVSTAPPTTSVAVVGVAPKVK